MRKITREATQAFINSRPYRNSNTMVTIENNRTYLYLHQNLIAHKDSQGNVKISDAGWATNVTKERLNAVIDHYCGPAARIYQRQWQWYWSNDQPFPHNRFFVIN